MKSIVQIFSWMLILSWSFIVQAQDHIQFKSYSIDNGLSQSVVYAIEQDKTGALWIGTQDGINKFQGKKFEIFTKNDSYDISSEYVNTICKDKNGNLWFGTNNGLVLYNTLQESFTSYTLEKEIKFEVKTITLLTDKIIIGTKDGRVYNFDLNTKTYTTLPIQHLKSAVIAILENEGNYIFATEFNGIYFFNTEKQIITSNYKLENLRLNNYISNKDEKLLFAGNKGLIYFDQEAKSFKPHFSFPIEEITNKTIVDALFIDDQKTLIATENNGLFQIDLSSEKVSIINYTADFYQKNTLLSDKITKLFKDKNGTIWIASQSGLNSFDPLNLGLRGNGFSVVPEKGLPSQNVWGFDEDSSTNYLFIAGDIGVTRFDKTQHFYEHFNRKQKANKDVTTLSLHVIDKNNVLVGAIDGFYHLNINEDDPSLFTFKPLIQYDDKSRTWKKTYTILKYAEHEYLIGTSGGVILHNLKKQESYYIEQAENIKSDGLDNACRYLFQLNDGSIYAAPSSGGLLKIDKNNSGELISRKTKKFSPINEKTNKYITSAVQINENEFWFATMGDGIYQMNTKTKIIKHYDRSNGLPNNVIYGIIYEKIDQSLWLSTNRGLVKLKIENNKVLSYFESDGLMSNELNLGASFKSKTGEIYFGGIQGYNYFDPKFPLNKTKDLKVVFSSFEVNNEKQIPFKSDLLTVSISQTNHIDLPYKKRSFNLTFFVDDLSHPERVEYKYELLGNQLIEEEIGKNNQLRLTNMSPGNYEIRVYARNIGGVWSSQPAKLSVSIATPFWYAWWFYMILIIILSLIVYIWVKKSIEHERREQVRLELKISQRTKEIREKSDKIEEQKKKLEEQKRALEYEKEKTERLLSNILPSETASQLKNDGKSAARDYSLVSVMFTDFVGFTNSAEQMSAKKLVAILDTYFSKFDEIIEKHNLEKIKTIGDAYMCAGGVPIRNKTNPIHTILAALKIQEYMQERKKSSIAKGEDYWRLRIGINTGPVSAGVIGTKRYAYDIWGRTVNRAQRMEQLCTPEKIAITEDTYEYIAPYFICTHKGKVATKNGLVISMYEVEGIKPELSENNDGINPNNSFHELVKLHFFSNINYAKAEKFILDKLKKELSSKLHYHSFDHSRDVTQQVERIAIAEGITDEDLFLLKTAASYHDAGFVYQYEKNEPIGVQMAKEILPNFGYTDKDIERITALIFATQIPHQPKNKLEEIICDADLDYLGRDDFHEIADKLRLELKEHGKINSDRKWDEIQINFLSQHRYFTKTAIETRLAKKMKHIEEIKERLKKDEYLD